MYEYRKETRQNPNKLKAKKPNHTTPHHQNQTKPNQITKPNKTKPPNKKPTANKKTPNQKPQTKNPKPKTPNHKTTKPKTKPETPKSMTPHEALKKYFGYDQFRLEQEAIVSHALAQQDALVLMPTGGGKSLCFQLPALLSEGVTIVISPLIALMKDQVDALRANGIKAAYLNSTLTSAQQDQVLRNIDDGVYKLVYVAPERLMSRNVGFLHFLQRVKVSMFAIDEAHCISHWGHDFRPEYLQLQALKVHFPHVPIMALTASADKITQQDIADKLSLNAPRVFLSSYNRANIRYTITPKQNSYAHLVRYLKEHKDESGIIYAFSRKSTEALAQRLSNDGYYALPYHAGLDTEVRSHHQDLFIKDEVQLIVATIAFGMGIDKSNVRFVIHVDMPKSVESYYQETGRAGRDGLESEALLFYTAADVMKWKQFMEADENEQQRTIGIQKLQKMAQFCEARQCRRQFLLNYFGEDAPAYCGNCDFCLSDSEMFDGTVIAQKALSAVARLDQRFGMQVVVDFLRGSKNERIRDHHKALKTYGIGKDLSKDEWLFHLRSLIGMGYIILDEGMYPVLKLTAKSKPVLMGEETVMLSMLPKPKEAVPTVAVRHNTQLFQELRVLRRTIAVQEGIPPYVVISDATMQELATYLPHSLTDLQQISGFGEVKTARYGETFVTKITAFCQEHGLETQIHHKPVKRQVANKVANKEANKEPKKSKGDTRKISLDLFRAGKTVAEIATERDLKKGTILGHLAEFMVKGLVQIDELVSPEKQAIVTQAYPEFADQTLSAFKEHLGKEVSYDDIRITIMHLQQSQAQNTAHDTAPDTAADLAQDSNQDSFQDFDEPLFF
jgi:ATP-dependent DNA helicase RecQ